MQVMQKMVRPAVNRPDQVSVSAVEDTAMIVIELPKISPESILKLSNTSLPCLGDGTITSTKLMGNLVKFI